MSQLILLAFKITNNNAFYAVFYKNRIASPHISISTAIFHTISYQKPMAI